MKNNFRKNVINIRSKLDTNSLSNNSFLITSKLLNMNCIKVAKTIMLYLDFNNEVKTDLLVTELLNLNKTVVAPITIKESRQLLPYSIINLSSNIKIGAYGIREPNPSICFPIDIRDVDIVIVPAVAFDINCFRLGYGGGFYDRFLIKLSKDTIIIGIAFDFQIFNEIPKEKHDFQLDYIVTEKRILTSECRKIIMD